jgi:glycosyltransferase involved in cell wall biosynthesis
MKIAIIHYWLVTMRGGERVLEDLCRIFPDADIYTHVVDRDAISPELASRRIFTTFIARMPLARRLYRHYVGLMPLALEQLDLREYDIVISCESGPAKGVITGTDTLHICYCHSPMRYLWNMYHEYRNEVGFLGRSLMIPVFHYLRQWDYLSAARVDHFVANSNTVAARIAKYYRREAEVIHPPVDTELFSPVADRGDFYLFCGQLVGYKRADQAIEAFNRMGKKLVVIGTGPDEQRLRRLAGPTVKMLGAQPTEVLRDLYAKCRALIFPGEEDFGIVPLETMASGRPVIALDRGGVQDTVIDGQTGILYPDQTVEGLIAAVGRFEAAEQTFLPEALSAHASQFSRSAFRGAFSRLVERKLQNFRSRRARPIDQR